MIRNLYILLLIMLIFSSCAQLTTFHSARTEGRGNITLSPTLSGFGVTNNGGGGELGNGTLPFVQMEVAYGLSNNLDLVGSVSSGGNFLGSVKYRMMGSNDSPFSLSVMPGYEYQSTYGNNDNYASRLHLPIIASYYTSEDLGFYFAPKYVIQVANNEEVFSYPGISAGIAIERRIKYNIGIGSFIPISYPIGAQGLIYQAGISMRIPIFSKN